MTQKMNPIIKAEWVAWLRNPEHRQGQSYLHLEDGTFCCLGGLCEIAKTAGIVINGTLHGQGHHTYCPPGDPGMRNASMLPPVVQEWAGVSSEDPTVVWRGNDEYLTKLNDAERLTFLQIADLIEEQL